MIRPEKKSEVAWRLATLAALASPAIALVFLAYLQSRPNTDRVVLTGPFDGQRAFNDLKRLVAFGPRPFGFAGPQALQGIYHQRPPRCERQRC
jgi:hypothetical protein